MISKLYSKILKILKDNIRFIILIVLLFVLLNLPLPYKITTSGHLLNLDEKVLVSNSYKSKGTLNLTYVKEIKGNVFTVLSSLINKEWDLVKEDNKKGINIDNTGSKILLNTSLNNAIYTAYKYLDKKVDVKKTKMYVIFVDEFANTDLESGDVVKEINGIEINDSDDINKIVKENNVGDVLKVKLENDEEKYIEIRKYGDYKKLYIYFVCDYIYDVKGVSFDFEPSESGSSGGLMIALSIYDKLTNKDITKGRTIAGTGTIDRDGFVGEISGIKYKIKGAKKADIFLVPTKNYEEAKKVIEENGYDVELKAIDTFDDSIKYLSE